MRPNQKIAMRFMIDNGVGLFASSVEFQALEPYPIIHIGYPESLNFKGIRNATRVAVTQYVLAVNNSKNTLVSVSGCLVDISISGARLELSGGFGAIGYHLSIKSSVVVHNVAQELTLSVVIRSLVELSEGPDGGDLVGYGVEFLAHTEQERLVIYAYVFNQMALQESITK